MTVEQMLKKLIELPLRIKCAFYTSLVVGILTHRYILTNKFSNADDLLNIKAYGSGIAYGGWLKGLLGPVINVC